MTLASGLTLIGLVVGALLGYSLGWWLYGRIAARVRRWLVGRRIDSFTRALDDQAAYYGAEVDVRYLYVKDLFRVEWSRDAGTSWIDVSAELVKTCRSTEQLARHTSQCCT